MPENKLFDRVAIIGVGLIGGSLGLAMKRYRLAEKIVGAGRNEKNLTLAKAIAAIDQYTTNPTQCVRDADLVIICTPVRTIVPMVSKIAPYLKKGAIVTDVGSTKGRIVAECDKLLPEGCYFVGGHPMTGSEQSGAAAAFPDLFRNTTYVLTPSEKTSIIALTKMTEFVCALGAKSEIMDASEHDRAVAATSHLPHVLSAALLHTADQAGKSSSKIMNLTAGSFKDLTRVSSSSTEMWRDICLTNVESLSDVINTFESYLEAFKAILERENEAELENFFKEAKAIRTILVEKKPK